MNQRSFRLFLIATTAAFVAGCSTTMTKECIDVAAGTKHCNVYAGVRFEEGVTRIDGYAFTPLPNGGMQRAHVGTTTGENMAKTVVKSVIPTALATAGSVVAAKLDADATKTYAKAIAGATGSGSSGDQIIVLTESNTTVDVGCGINNCQ